MYQVNHGIAVPFSAEELTTLQGLRARYEDDRDLFTQQEREGLKFLRWLIFTGRLVSENAPYVTEAQVDERMTPPSLLSFEEDLFDGAR